MNKLYRTASDASLMHYNIELGKVLLFSRSTMRVMYTDSLVKDVLLLCANGKSHDEIINFFVAEHNYTLESAKKVIKELLENSVIVSADVEVDNSITEEMEDTIHVTPPKPIATYLHLTNDCNLNCVYCFNESIRHCSGDDSINPKVLGSVLNELREAGVKYLYLTGGEPLLRLDLLRVISSFKDHFDIQIMTNGMLIDDDNINIIKETVHKVQLSIDSHIESVVDKLRGYGVFKAIMNAISLLNENGIDWKVSAVLTKDNISQFETTRKYFLDKGALDVRTSIIDPIDDETALLLPSFHQIEEYQKRYVRYIHGLFRNGTLSKATMPTVWVSCGAASGEISISPNLHLHPCQELMSSEWSAGKLDGDNFAELYNYSPVFEDLRKQISRIPSYCCKCSFIEFCKGACFAKRAKFENEKSMDRLLFCHNITSRISELLALEGEIANEKIYHR